MWSSFKFSFLKLRSMKISPSHTHLLLLKKKRAIYSHSTYLQLWVLEALVKKLSHLWIILALRDELQCDHQKHCYCGTLRVTDHSWRARMSSSLHSPCTSWQLEVRPCPSLLLEGASSVETSCGNSACVLSSAICPARTRDLARCCPQLKEMWKCVVQGVE